MYIILKKKSPKKSHSNALVSSIVTFSLSLLLVRSFKQQNLYNLKKVRSSDKKVALRRVESKECKCVLKKSKKKEQLLAAGLELVNIIY